MCGFSALLAWSYFIFQSKTSKHASLSTFPPCNPQRIPLIISNQSFVFGWTTSFLLHLLSAGWGQPPRLTSSSARWVLPGAKPQAVIVQHSLERTREASHGKTWSKTVMTKLQEATRPFDGMKLNSTELQRKALLTEIPERQINRLNYFQPVLLFSA